jgi:hypothetical protein
MQQIGRVMRISPQTGKLFGVILDQAGNLDRLGFPEDIREYNLPKARQAKSNEERQSGTTPSKTCPNCATTVPNFMHQCGCGYCWPSSRSVNLEDLIEVYPSSQARQINQPEILKQMFQQFRQRAYRLGYSITLAEQQFTEYTGKLPQDEWCFGSIFNGTSSHTVRTYYLDYLIQSADSIFNEQNNCEPNTEAYQWVSRNFELEFGPGALADLLEPEVSHTYKNLSFG